MKEHLQEMYFSQAALAAYQTCALKFRYRYLDELYWLQTGHAGGHAEERALGESFHLMAQRYFQNVAPDYLDAIKPSAQLKVWLNSLREKFPLRDELRYYPEQELRTVIEKARFTAKYDLLVQYPDGRIIIYDWKTQASPGPGRTRPLQARVYALVLYTAEPFGKRRPEDITTVFWNPRFPGDEQVWPYSRLLYEQDRAELTALVGKITDLQYGDFSGLRPAEDGSAKGCRWCEYAALCNAGGQVANAGPLPSPGDVSWDDVEEIAYEEA